MVQAKLEVAPSSDAAEREADQAARAAAAGARFHITRRGAAVARRVHRTDMRAGTAPLTASTQEAVRNQLYPSRAAAPGQAPPEWDGLPAADGSISAQARRNRADLERRVIRALVRHLSEVRAAVTDVSSRRKLPMTSMEGPGRAAKAATDRRFGDWATASALTGAQRHTRSSHQFRASGPDQDLFDATDPAQRAAAGQGIDPWDLAGWMAETDDQAHTAQRAHSFDPNRTQTEGDFLWNEILPDFVNAHEAELRRYDQYMFGMADPDTGNIVIGPQVAGHLSDTSPGNGAPSPAERHALWSAWKTLVHEYIHTLEHPACQSWPGRNRVISEGFCELSNPGTNFNALRQDQRIVIPNH